MPDELDIVGFRPAHQDDARRLILAGLAEHFENPDPSRNPDLDDIAETYGCENFFVAFAGDALIGTGGLVRENRNDCRIVRMSVENSHRRGGIGTAILNHLIAVAASRGYTRIVLETTLDWHRARAFYRANGFDVVDIDEARGEINFERAL